MNATHPSKWYRRIGWSDDAQNTVIWIPHAGGGAAPLIRLAKQSPPDINLFVATLPGREARYRDPMPATLEELTARLVDELPPLKPPPVLVGHSFGGLLAYCIAQHREVGGLTIMAMSSPERIAEQASIVHLSDSDFVEELDRRYGGVPKSLKENDEAMQLFLPTVRHDLTLLESYRMQGDEILDTPITALLGTQDTRVTAAEMQAWRDRTTAAFNMRTLPGDHFFPLAHFSSVLRIAQAMFGSRG